MSGHNLILILGPSAAGKTSLGERLAQTLGGQSRSMGGLIREAVSERPPLAAEYARIATGKGRFRTELLAELLGEAWEGRAVTPLILDAGAGIAEALRMLNLLPDLVLGVQAGAALRRERFAKRNRAEPSMTNVADGAIFDRRESSLSAGAIEAYVAVSASSPVYSIDAGGTRDAALLQGLSACIHAGAVRLASPARYRVERDALLDFARNGDTPATANVLDDDSEWHAPLLFLLKPGMPPNAALINIVLQRFAGAGYRPRAAARWPGDQIRTRGVARAHFDKHYLYARYSALAADGMACAQKGATPAVRGALDPAFRRSTAFENGRARRIAQSLWAELTPDVVIANGHMPTVLADFERDRALVTAIAFDGAPGATGLAELRADLLGDSDPAQAPANSLRGLAAARRLAGAGPVSFINNGFHLSASHPEAVREIGIWLGQDYADGIAARISCGCGGTRCRCLCIDRPDGIGLYYQNAERLSATQSFSRLRELTRWNG